MGKLMQGGALPCILLLIDNPNGNFGNCRNYLCTEELYRNLCHGGYVFIRPTICMSATMYVPTTTTHAEAERIQRRFSESSYK